MVLFLLFVCTVRSPFWTDFRWFGKKNLMLCSLIVQIILLIPEKDSFLSKAAFCNRNKASPGQWCLYLSNVGIDERYMKYFEEELLDLWVSGYDFNSIYFESLLLKRKIHVWKCHLLLASMININFLPHHREHLKESYWTYYGLCGQSFVPVGSWKVQPSSDEKHSSLFQKE